MASTNCNRNTHPLKSLRSVVALTAITIMLQSCGGSGGDSGDSDIGANGIHVDLQDCSYLLNAGLSADDINAGGSCIFVQEDGSTGFASIGNSVTDGDPLNPDITGVSTPVNDDDDDNDLTAMVTNPDLLEGDVDRNPALADVAGSDFYPDPNNSAILSGAVVGDGSIDNSMLSRSIPFEIESQLSEVAVEHVYAVRDSDTDTDVIVIVRNVSAEPQCFVQTNDMYVLDQSGDRVDSTFSFSFVEGTVYQLTVVTTNTCLDPGQLGYMRKRFPLSLDEVQAVNAGSFEVSSTTSRIRLTTPVIPVSYEVLPSGEVEVLVVNQGLTDVDLTFSNIFILDSDGYPLGTVGGFDPEILTPGAESIITFNASDFRGSATTLRVVIDWDIPEE